MGEVIGFPQREAQDEPGSGPDSEPEPLWREAVGRQLREVRHEQDRTLADVAQEAGVSTQYLSEIERGRKEPSSEILGAVAGALGLRLVDLTSRLTRSLSSRPRISSRPSGPLALAA